jgi:O-antigen/teichoic acid export membrane protein
MVSSRILCLILSLVQMGIIFRALTVEASGQFGFALNYPALFTVFATLGIQRLLVRDVARNPEDAWTQTWTAAAVLSALSIIVTAIIMGSTDIFENDVTTRHAVFMATLSVIVLYAVQRPFESLLMAREQMTKIAVINLAGGIGRLIFTWVAVKMSATSAAAHAGIAAGNFIAFLLCVAAAIKVAGWERPRIRLGLARSQILESNAFTMATLFSLLYFKSDMSILKWLEGEAPTGIYTAAQRVTEPLFMISAIWGTTVFPALCRMSVNAPDNYERLVRMSTRLILLVAFPMAAGIGVLSEPIIHLLTGAKTAEFHDAVRVLRILCIVTPFFYFNSVGQEFLYARQRNWLVANTYALASLISVVGNLLYIPRYGVIGVGWVAVAANAFVSFRFYSAMATEYGAMQLWSLGAKTMTACTVMGACAYLIAGKTLIGAIFIGALFYFAIQYLLRTLDPDEQLMLAALFRRR